MKSLRSWFALHRRWNGDGSGSTTVTERLTAHLTSKETPVYRTCEPSGGPIVRSYGRSLLIGWSFRAPRVVSPGFTTMALLFASDRMDHLQAECSRAFATASSSSPIVTISRVWPTRAQPRRSTIRANPKRVGWIRELNRQARRPDLTLVLDVRPEVAAERRRSRGATRDLYEEGELQARLARAYAAAEELVPAIASCTSTPMLPSVTSFALASRRWSNSWEHEHPPISSRLFVVVAACGGSGAPRATRRHPRCSRLLRQATCGRRRVRVICGVATSSRRSRADSVTFSRAFSSSRRFLG